MSDRESMEYDVVIVGGGPAGLAASIRLKQVNPELSVCILEKGSEIGAHILSGAVVDPKALNELLPTWREDGCPMAETPVTDNWHWVLSRSGKISLPHIMMPPLMSNHGNYTGSLGNLCRWLAGQAEALGVEIFPGFPAAEVLYAEDGPVRGVATGDMGIARDGSRKPDYQPGMELLVQLPHDFRVMVAGHVRVFLFGKALEHPSIVVLRFGRLVGFAAHVGDLQPQPFGP